MNLNICRACLSNDADKDMKNTISCKGKNITFIEVAHFCLGIEVYNTPYGSKLCSKCLKKLRGFYKFKTLALKNDCHFKKFSNSSVDLGAVKVEIDDNVKNDFSTSCVEDLGDVFHHSILEDTSEPEIEINGNEICSKPFCDNFGGVQDDGEVKFTSKLEVTNDIKKEKDIKLEEEHSEDDMLLSAIQKIKYEYIENEPNEINDQTLKVNKRKVVKNKSSNKEQVCAECGIAVKNIKDHMKKHLPVDQKKIIKCRHCDKMFCAYGARLKHEKFKHYGKTLKCEQCGKAVVNLRAHILIMHERSSLKHKCFVCEKSFLNKTNLENHISSNHTKERSFKCEICEKTFALKITLDLHRRQVHEQERTFMCQFCSKSFFKKYHLQVHIRSHTKEKPYICKECGRGFGSSTVLKQHMTIHSGAKNYKCTLCELSFARHTYLRRHTLSHTKEKNYPCHYCGVKFLRTDHRKRHEFTAHQKFQDVPKVESEGRDK